MIDFENPTQEQIERAKECETVSDLMSFAADEGYELSDEDLEAVSGGMKIVTIKAPSNLSPILRFIFRIKKDQQS